MTLGSVPVRIDVLARQQLIQTIEKVGFAAGTEFQQDQARGGMRQKDIQEAVIFAPHELFDFSREIDNPALVAGLYGYAFGLHSGGV